MLSEYLHLFDAFDDICEPDPAVDGPRILAEIRDSLGNEQWEFDEHGLMQRREASINDRRIEPAERKFHWSLGPRPADHPGLSELGL